MAIETVTIPCGGCSSLVHLEPSRTSYICADCRSGFVFRTCGSCKQVSQAPVNARRWYCSACGNSHRVPMFSPPSAPAWRLEDQIMARGSHEAEDRVPRREGAVDMNLRDLGGFTVVGGYGHTLQNGAKCNMTCGSDSLVIRSNEAGRRPVKYAHDEIISLDVGGPGAVRKGGGFVGGGFGAGAVEGMAVAAILNGLTTKNSVNTIVQIVAQSSSLILHNNKYTPHDIEMAVATLKARITQARAEPQTDPVEQLQKLAQLKDAGVVTDEEFQAAKAKLMKRLT